MEVQRTRRVCRREPCDPAGIERGVRQLLADKVSGTMMGVWLLIPEHLRLGTWDLLKGWTGKPGRAVEPRLALQLVHEAALCRAGVRKNRALGQKGFELANGLPFVAADQAIHLLLNNHTVAEAQDLQLALGKIRRAGGHYQGRLLAIDPHHMRSHTKRQTRRHRHKERQQAVKTVQSYFCLDADSGEPLAFTIASSAKTVTQGLPKLLDMAAEILHAKKGETLVLADKEHFCAELFLNVANNSPFRMLVPIPNLASRKKQMRDMPSDLFRPRWTGLATAKVPYQFKENDSHVFQQIVQRCGEGHERHDKAFLAVGEIDELEALVDHYPKRWHVEEFFNANQALGWKRGGTLNLHIRYGQMTMALIAQAAIHQLRKRIGAPVAGWDADHLAKNLLNGLDGDVRVVEDTIVVTYYNAPNVEILRRHYENLPKKLENENVDPHMPWLYNFKLDFRFK